LISQSGGVNLIEQQKLILEKILCKLNEQRFAQGRKKKFDLVKITDTNISLLRRNAKVVKVKISEIEAMILVFLKEPNKYDYNISLCFKEEVDKVTKHYIDSPIWALLHLVEKHEYFHHTLIRQLRRV